LKPLIPLLAWTLALATLAGAALELHKQRDSADATAALSAVPRFTIKENALLQKDYQAIQKKTPVFGSVEIVAGASNLTVRASALSDYAAWRLTLDQVLLDNPGITWRIETLCSGHCPGGEAHQAVLTGVRLSGNVEPRGDGATVPANKASGSVLSYGPKGRYVQGKG
jgi:hypothetical protein